MADSLSRSLGQRNALAIVVEHVFDFDRGRTDVNDLVAAIDNVAFDRDEYVAVLREEDLLGFAGLVGEAEELERDGRRGRRRGAAGGGGRPGRCPRFGPVRRAWESLRPGPQKCCGRCRYTWSARSRRGDADQAWGPGALPPDVPYRCGPCECAAWPRPLGRAGPRSRAHSWN